MKIKKNELQNKMDVALAAELDIQAKRDGKPTTTMRLEKFAGNYVVHVIGR